MILPFAKVVFGPVGRRFLHREGGHCSWHPQSVSDGLPVHEVRRSHRVVIGRASELVDRARSFLFASARILTSQFQRLNDQSVCLFGPTLLK